MLEKSNQAKREYFKQYRNLNREKIRKQHKEWREKNPEKMKLYRERYWAKKAAERHEDNVYIR